MHLENKYKLKTLTATCADIPYNFSKFGGGGGIFMLSKYIVMGIDKQLRSVCVIAGLLLQAAAYGQTGTGTLQSLAQQFSAPPEEYRPYVWWHWMGSNFSKEGIRKDLEAMQEAGIGGATIFNIASSVQETHVPMDNNPWPERTYRSDYYWDAMRFAAAEAKRLGLKLGIHNSPGYSTTGGPWISEEQGMQTLVCSKTTVKGNRPAEVFLQKPELPVYQGYGTSLKQATYYKDVAVMAVPEQTAVCADDVMDISACMDAEGRLRWQAPAGDWAVFRIGHAPTMSNPHPLPDELIGRTLEVDKMSREHNVYHWQQMLNPLVERLKEYIGVSFTYIHIDSYEAGDQDWTASFREEFIRLKGYDPLPWIALRYSAGEREDLNLFEKDYGEVISRLFIDNGWKTAREMIHAAGLRFQWEPYGGQFALFESVSIPDFPMDEFWTGGDGRIGATLVKAAATHGKRIISAEAFTGRPEISRYTEDPAALKHSADGSFVSGANRLFLHHWVHQPFDDRYQPGIGMGWWGTHFGRHQTWIKPAKAFFTYLSRCQMLLQQGNFISSSKDVLHRQTPDAELFFVINPDTSAVEKTFAFPVKRRIPELWDAYNGVIRQTARWKEQGDSIFVDLQLQPDESVFVVFPFRQETYAKLPAIEVSSEAYSEITGVWDVTFQPKLEPAFRKKKFSLVDWSRQRDPALKYFAGTAAYRKTIHIGAGDTGKYKRTLLDLGEMHDIAELEINGKTAGALWAPPYRADITPWLHEGDNHLTIYVTDNWANRLIGDEQYPADFEWGTDRGEELGRAMKSFPPWFAGNQPRPSQGRKTFSIWYYHRKNSPLQPAGLIGPVRLVKQDLK
ncbi:MAG: alpha-L-rhamnosidase [Bacteroidales bacterium]